ncbi:MAG TPA: 3-dehydroquinate synthase [Caulobacteraceae bacterium]|nr:3-dehydroquinate synthase [Caulobacteraceae bacterium]
MRTVRVEGEGFRAYEVLVGRGLLPRAGYLIRPVLNRPRVAVISDETVAGLYGEALIDSLADAGVSANLITVPPGEGSKSFAELERLCDRLLAMELTRKDAVVAFGGGVVGDLAGFAASIYMRGIDHIQIPTTLLAQVDSSVGGKTAIDTPRGKNLIGAFWQPRMVIADPDLLQTLPERELKAGYAEVLKYGLLGDADLFRRLETLGPQLFDPKPDSLTKAIARSVEMKAEIVAEDAREAGRRMLLNLGHTFGHALEAETGFGPMLHGEAVALGTAMAYRFSVKRGLCPGKDADRAERALAAVGLPTRLEQAPGAPFKADRLLGHMAKDKKAEGGKLVLVLAEGIGRAVPVRDVEPAALRRFLIEEGAQA